MINLLDYIRLKKIGKMLIYNLKRIPLAIIARGKIIKL